MSNQRFDFIDKYNSLGADNFYRLLVAYGEDRINNIKIGKKPRISPEIELLEYHDKYLELFKKDKNITNLNLSIVFKRAANKIYRIMLKDKMISKNNKFLTPVE